jgi:hypothetical protein
LRIRSQVFCAAFMLSTSSENSFITERHYAPKLCCDLRQHITYEQLGFR